MSCLFGHRWTKWKTYGKKFLDPRYIDKEGKHVELFNPMQKRRCKRCGYEEHEEL